MKMRYTWKLTHSRSLLFNIIPVLMCCSNFLFCFPSPMWACRGRTVGAHFKTPSSSNSRSNQREEGGSRGKKKKKNTDKCQPMGARRDARCPLRVAHHWVSDEVLVVSGAGSRERGPCGNSSALVAWLQGRASRRPHLSTGHWRYR